MATIRDAVAVSVADVESDWLAILHDPNASLATADKKLAASALPLTERANTFSARQAFTGGVSIESGIRSIQVTLSDDTIVNLVSSYNAPTEGLIIYMIGTAQGYAAIVSFRAGTTPYCQIVAQYGSTTSVGTTELTAGTSDGTDGNVNICATADGKLIIKNRTGGSRRFTALVIG